MSVHQAVFLDLHSYLRYPTGTLVGGENSLTVQFRFCSDHGMLLYQNGGDRFFAMGIHSSRLYLEWKMSNTVIEVSRYHAQIYEEKHIGNLSENRVDWGGEE